MTEAAPDKVQIKYAQQYRELKQILLAKHFAGKAHFMLPYAIECSHCTKKGLEVMWCTRTGLGVQQKVEVDGLQITFTEGPPLKKFVTPPKLSEDLAK